MNIYVFDYTAGNIYKFSTDKHYESDEDMLSEWGFDPNDCHWMITDDELEIINLEMPLL